MLPNRRSRQGMSLTELLVVIGILGLLAITVVPAINANADARKNRIASGAVESFIDQAQARSIGRRTWSGFRLIPLNAGSYAADRLVFVDCPDPYRGDSASAAVTITGPGTGTTSPMDFAGLPQYVQDSNDTTVRFAGLGVVYRLTSGTVTSPLTFALQGPGAGENLGQTASTTPWPATGVAYPIEIFRSPIPAGTPLTIPENRVIDMSWSGYGPSAPSITGTSQFALGSPITVTFDTAGSLRQFSFATPVSYPALSNETATAPLFLLVGRADRVGQAPAALDPNDDSLGANFQYADSSWVAIDPATGIATTAPCDPDPSSTALCINSQRLISDKLKSKRSPRKKDKPNGSDDD